MDCGIALLSGNWWAGLLTWVAFAVVATAVVTFLAARRQHASGSAGNAASGELLRLADKVEELSRRLERLERTSRT
jgi:membrane protein implicated in regulation of membrane protease activity